MRQWMNEWMNETASQASINLVLFWRMIMKAYFIYSLTFIKLSSSINPHNNNSQPQVHYQKTLQKPIKKIFLSSGTGKFYAFFTASWNSREMKRWAKWRCEASVRFLAISLWDNKENYIKWGVKEALNYALWVWILNRSETLSLSTGWKQTSVFLQPL